MSDFEKRILREEEVMLPGGCVGFDGAECICGRKLQLQVLQSPAGYYLGYFCNNCGPYSRETNYMPDLETVKQELAMVLEYGTTLYARF